MVKFSVYPVLGAKADLPGYKCIIVGGLKGYERLLSLSKDLNNPKWKPLHMAASWNSRNRRIAKQRSKTNWYKGKEEVEPPTTSSTGGGGDHPSQKADEVPRKRTPEKSSLKDGKSRKKRARRGTTSPWEG